METIAIGTIIVVVIATLVCIFSSLFLYVIMDTPKNRIKAIRMTVLFTTMSAFVIWLVWIAMYLSQMYPMIAPVRHGHEPAKPIPIKDET